MKDLIVVKQLPIIEEQLKQLSTEIDKKVENAVSLVCNEDTVKEVKKVRAELNNNFKELEEQRKTVKNAIMQPYTDFETVYNNLVGSKFKEADSTLKSKIDSVENQLKADKEKEVRDYFEEQKESNHLDFITFERANVNVTISASMKSLKEQVKSFTDKIVDDLKLIDTQENKEEILVEYKQSLNVSNSIMVVTDRKRRLEEERNAQAELQRIKEAEQKVIEKVVEVVQAPKIVEAQKVVEPVEEKVTLTFAVTSTESKLRELIKFMNEGGYKVEQR